MMAYCAQIKFLLPLLLLLLSSVKFCALRDKSELNDNLSSKYSTIVCMLTPYLVVYKAK